MALSVVLVEGGAERVLHDKLADAEAAKTTFRYERLELKKSLGADKTQPDYNRKRRQLQLRRGTQAELVWPALEDETKEGTKEGTKEQEKKQLSGYQFFAREKRQEAAQTLDTSVKGKGKAVMGVISAWWKELDASEKKTWARDAPFVAAKKKKKKKESKGTSPQKKKKQKKDVEAELTAAVFALVKDSSRFGLLVQSKRHGNWPAIVLDPRAFYSEVAYRLVLAAPTSDLVLFLGEDAKQMFGSLKTCLPYDASADRGDEVPPRAIAIADELAELDDLHCRLLEALDAHGFSPPPDSRSPAVNDENRSPTTTRPQQQQAASPSPPPPQPPPQEQPERQQQKSSPRKKNTKKNDDDDDDFSDSSSDSSDDSSDDDTSPGKVQEEKDGTELDSSDDSVRPPRTTVQQDKDEDDDEVIFVETRNKSPYSGIDAFRTTPRRQEYIDLTLSDDDDED
mmetsp:Transcript_26106/g.80295  ORF Transcript_26106/g.80295 Transcript_26106/m.80295 type:complete len:453 (-) Transcript_26106:1438-2796(-)